MWAIIELLNFHRKDAKDAKLFKVEEMIDIEVIAKDVVDCAIKVHKTLGPGLLESAHQFCHAYELRKRGWIIETEVKLPLVYENQKVDVGYRIDTLVNGLVIIENKTVEALLPVHDAQLLT